MKIIADTGNGEFVVIARKAEINKVWGKHLERPIPIGAEIEVSEIYYKLQGLSAARSQLEGAQRSLRALADMLEPLADTIEVSLAIDMQGGE